MPSGIAKALFRTAFLSSACEHALLTGSGNGGIMEPHNRSLFDLLAAQYVAYTYIKTGLELIVCFRLNLFRVADVRR